MVMIERSRSKPEVEFQYGGCLFHKPKVYTVVIFQPLIEISHRFFAYLFTQHVSGS